MPSQQAKKSSAGLSKYAGRGSTVLKDNLAAPIKLGKARLPAGIERGVAQLDNCRLAEIKEGIHAGDLGFYADGIVFAPLEFKGERIAGSCRTSIITIPLCDLEDTVEPGKKGSFEDQWDKITTHVRALLLQSKVDLMKEIDPDDTKDVVKVQVPRMQALCKRLQTQLKPFFSFKTYASGCMTIRQSKDGLWWGWEAHDKPDKDHPDRKEMKLPAKVVEYGGKKHGPYSTEQEARMKNKGADKDPLVFENWLGTCPAPDQGTEPTDAPGVDDDSGSNPPIMEGEKNGPPQVSPTGKKGKAPPPSSNPAVTRSKAPPPKPGKKVESAPEPEPDESPSDNLTDFLGGTDLDQLVIDCDDPEAYGDARARLEELYLKLPDKTSDDFINEESYETAATTIREYMTELDSEETEPEELVPGDEPSTEELEPPPPAEVAPKQVYLYTPPKSKKSQQVMVTAVNKKTTPHTVNLVSLGGDKTPYKGVSVDDLESIGG